MSRRCSLLAAERLLLADGYYVTLRLLRNLLPTSSSSERDLDLWGAHFYTGRRKHVPEHNMGASRFESMLGIKSPGCLFPSIAVLNTHTFKEKSIDMLRTNTVSHVCAVSQESEGDRKGGKKKSSGRLKTQMMERTKLSRKEKKTH